MDHMRISGTEPSSVILSQNHLHYVKVLPLALRHKSLTTLAKISQIRIAHFDWSRKGTSLPIEKVVKGLLRRARRKTLM